MAGIAAVVVGAGGARGAAPREIGPFLKRYCVECHDTETKKGGLDLTVLKWDLTRGQNFAAWVGVHDRIESGEMPPKKKARPETAETAAFLKAMAGSLLEVEQKQSALQGRTTARRMNRYEYENTVRDLLGAPWLQLRDTLPEDGESHRFNKIGDALDISYVQMSRYLGAADYALRQAMAGEANRPATRTVKYYAREQKSFTGKMKFSQFNMSPERATFPALGSTAQPEVRAFKAPMTAGSNDPQQRELEGVGVVASTYEPLEIRFDQFKAPAAGHYTLRFCAESVWVGPGPSKRWWTPDLDKVSVGRRSEPVTVYSEIPPRLLRRLGTFDVEPVAGVKELDVWLLEGETIRPDAARFFRSRPPAYHNPLAEKDGSPGVVFRWMEVHGPIHDQWPPPGHRLMFGDLPLKNGDPTQVVSTQPQADAQRLMRGFVQRAYRRPVSDAEALRFVPVVDQALQSGSGFADAMIAGYTAVLCSPEFLRLEEKPGKLDDYALATRLAYFLWNSGPDEELKAVAARGELHRPEILRAQTERLLGHPRSRQFVEAFLDYWLDLRKIVATGPDAELYPDYYLDDLLSESALDETQLFFAELIKADLPARNLVASDFAMLNERLAQHYGVPGVSGVALRRVQLPPGSVRGGLMTQASVLKVTANGTTTSPVLRGAWIMERMLGKPPPPPPASVPAIEPDIRGAATIRQQLEKHRTQASCSGCHAKMDPAGFALESFDVMGGWRERYRAEGNGKPATGIGHNGQPFAFHDALPVDASGELPDGRTFRDIREFKRLLLADEKQIARNLVQQLTVYATGAPIRFSDRQQIEQILQRSQARQYSVRTLLHEIVQSELFQTK